jgi:hypothetical protein
VTGGAFCFMLIGVEKQRRFNPMSTSFFITPVDPKAWEDPNDTSPKPTSDLWIDVQTYREGLARRWEGIIFRNSDASRMKLSWELPLEEKWYGGLQGDLHEDQQSISFGTGPKKSFIDFILWHRSFVLDKYLLFLSNSSSWDSLKLMRDTTEQNIVEFTGIVS